NRNFEGRVNPHAKANFLASPPLVVAYALAGRVDIDLNTEPLGTDKNGRPVYLKDIWPSQDEINRLAGKYVTSAIFQSRYKNVDHGTKIGTPSKPRLRICLPGMTTAPIFRIRLTLLALNRRPSPSEPLRARVVWSWWRIPLPPTTFLRRVRSPKIL